MNTDLKNLAVELLESLSKSSNGSVLRIDSSGVATLREFGKHDQILNANRSNENLINYMYTVMAYEKEVCYAADKKQFASLIHFCNKSKLTSFFKIETIPEIEVLDLTILK